ncbi:MAG: PrsW family intramembrane metalloprotease [Moorea sp. SIO4A3]|nr:PrsW family intramembrane metalloprotease [Moorena sp. SIO4A3]
MTGQVYSGFLRQLSTSDNKEILALLPLSELEDNVIGRDPNCKISLDPYRYVSVSRRHAVISPLTPLKNGCPRWEICDLDSVNGTYVNGEYLQGCQQLQSGDRIELGHDGPKFIFECEVTTSLNLPSIPSQTIAIEKPPKPIRKIPKPQTDYVTFTQLFPILSTGRDLNQKAFLAPGIVTVLFVVSMFAAVGQPVVFNLLLAAYLAGLAYYFVYQLCGKPKPWWVLLGSTLGTSLILVSPLLPLFIKIFRGILPGDIPQQGEVVNLTTLFIRMFFGAGLMEELLKAIPMLGVYALGQFLRTPWRERIGVWEPLDGILLGTASGVGFTLVETLGQYVPNIIDGVILPTTELQGDLLGLQLLIPRVLGSVAGHMAYSGYFGYFIGLSVLKPRKRWQIIGIGYLNASALHALWNAMGYVNSILLAIVGVVSYVFLTAAILKARALSPTRSQNFATQFFKN